MDKSTLILIITILFLVAVLILAGEYFIYKYYSLLETQPAAQSSGQQIQSVSSSSASKAVKNNNVKQPAGSSADLITSFIFQNPASVGIVDQANHTVTLMVPPVTDITRLTPIIEISQNATIFPLSGSQQDFINPVNYTVTAQNGSTQNYTVTVNVASIMKSAGNLITSFKLSGFTPEVVGNIDDNDHTVYAVVPDGTDITKLTPTIEISDGASVFPQSGEAQDFTAPVTYTVTDIYGVTQNYTVTVVTESNSG